LWLFLELVVSNPTTTTNIRPLLLPTPPRKKVCRSSDHATLYWVLAMHVEQDHIRTCIDPRWSCACACHDPMHMYVHDGRCKRIYKKNNPMTFYHIFSLFYKTVRYIWWWLCCVVRMCPMVTYYISPITRSFGR
jgi:hypothetical protein